MKGGKRGLFEEAHGGTIFLDEIGDASMEFQCTLLRVIQERQVRRVGGIKEIPVNVRIIAATNKNLTDEIKKGKFRSDLYYRLNFLPLKLPSLRERKSDIKVLANYFLKKYSNGKISDISQVLDDEAKSLLFIYDWPGNIRQLENTMEYLAIIGSSKCIGKKELPEYITESIYNNENTIVADLLGKDMVWILRKINQYESLGRRHLAELATKENIQLKEGQIRSLLRNAEELGLIEANIGRQGTMLTKKGYSVMSLVCNNGI